LDGQLGKITTLLVGKPFDFMLIQKLGEDALVQSCNHKITTTMHKYSRQTYLTRFDVFKVFFFSKETFQKNSGYHWFVLIGGP
jgi:hypothetical protein